MKPKSSLDHLHGSVQNVLVFITNNVSKASAFSTKGQEEQCKHDHVHSIEICLTSSPTHPLTEYRKGAKLSLGKTVL